MRIKVRVRARVTVTVTVRVRIRVRVRAFRIKNRPCRIGSTIDVTEMKSMRTGKMEGLSCRGSCTRQRD